MLVVLGTKRARLVDGLGNELWRAPGDGCAGSDRVARVGKLALALFEAVERFVKERRPSVVAVTVGMEPHRRLSWLLAGAATTAAMVALPEPPRVLVVPHGLVGNGPVDLAWLETVAHRL